MSSRIGVGCPTRGFVRSLGLALRELVRKQDGASTVEFALVAVPFMMLLFGIIEFGMILLVDVSLSNSALALARQIRVGGVIAPGVSATSSSGSKLDLADFKQAICNGVQLIPNAACLANIQIDLRTQSTFAGQTNPNPVTGSTFSNSSFCFYSGTPGSIVELRVFYLWSLLNPILLAPMVQITSVTSSNGTATGKFFMLTSSEVFKNEQNASSTNTGNGC